jgi:hypothetical protein
VQEGVHGITLQSANFDGLLIVTVIDASAFAENVHRTDTGTTGAKDVGVEYGESGAAQIALRDFLDEARNVNVRGAGSDARRVETIEATIGFGEGGLIVERRVEVREARSEFGIGFVYRGHITLLGDEKRPEKADPSSTLRGTQDDNSLLPATA